MIIESFEHIMPAATDKTAAETFINTAIKPAMAEAGYKLIRWCWAEAADGSLLLISLGEHESPQSVNQVWSRPEMLAARNQFYQYYPDAKVTRRILQVIEG